jgi:uncharacterized membrane protein HdeD (DUF308 family)
MKRINKINKIKNNDNFYLYQGLTLLIIGVIFLFLTSAFIDIVITVLSVSLIVIGIGIIIYHFIFRPLSKYLFLSLFLIILGILLLWFLLPFIFGIIAFFFGTYKLQKYFVTKNFINLIEGILSIALVLFIIFNPGTTGLIFLKIIGAYLILIAIPLLIYYFKLKNSRYVKVK